jgi:DNA-directed RNA polymerase specialized sigma24 family protein
VEIGLTPHRISEDESWRRRRLAERWLYRAGAQNAEDLASDSGLRLLRNLSNGAQIENLDAYVCQVAKNVLRESRRQKSREVELSAAIASTASLNSYPAAELLAGCLDAAGGFPRPSKALRLYQTFARKLTPMRNRSIPTALSKQNGSRV